MHGGQMIVVLLFSYKSVENQGMRSASDLSKSVVETVQHQDKAFVKAYMEETQENSGSSFDRYVSCLPYFISSLF